MSQNNESGSGCGLLIFFGLLLGLVFHVTGDKLQAKLVAVWARTIEMVVNVFNFIWFGFKIAVIAALVAPLIYLIYWVVKGVVEDEREAKREARRAKMEKAYELQQISLRKQSSVGPWTLDLPLNGREITVPRRLLCGRVYRIELSGVYQWERLSDTERVEGLGDPLYYTDEFSNFSWTYSQNAGLYINGKDRDDWPAYHIAEERHRHHYALKIDGTDNFLSLAFRPPVELTHKQQNVTITARVRVEPEGTPAIGAEQQTALVRAKELERVQELERKIATLVVMSEGLKNWSSAAFRKAAAKKYTTETLSKRQSILAEYFQLQKDPELAHRLKHEHPEAWAGLTGKFEALLEAERVDVKPERANQRKETSEEFRDRKERRARITALDEQANLKSKIAAYDEKRQVLLDRGLSQDEIDQYLPFDDVVDEALKDKRGERHDNAITVG